MSMAFARSHKMGRLLFTALTYIRLLVRKITGSILDKVLIETNSVI